MVKVVKPLKDDETEKADIFQEKHMDLIRIKNFVSLNRSRIWEKPD